MARHIQGDSCGLVARRVQPIGIKPAEPDLERRIDYYFSMSSAPAYFGADLLESLSLQHGLRVRYIPVDAGLTRGHPEVGRDWVTPAMSAEVAHGDLGLASRLVIAALHHGVPCYPLYREILHAKYCDEQDITDEATLRSVLHGLRLDDERLMRDVGHPRVVTAQHSYTLAAVEASICIFPTYIYRGEVFEGLEGLHALQETIAIF